MEGIANGDAQEGPDARRSPAAPRDATDATAKERYQIGVASYYGKRFHNRKTANGEIFDMYGLTAAHRTFRLGTIIRVTNIANGRSVIVKVNDRGPYARGRILDLSYAAAQQLRMLDAGIATVLIEVVDGEP